MKIEIATLLTAVSPLLLLITLSSVGHVSAIAVMSVDLGAEWMKIAIVKPGVPMEIVLNKESRRKTPVAIAMRGDERLFGEDAINLGVRYPATAFLYLQDLVGKSVDNPVVKLYQERFPYHKLTADPDRNTVMFETDTGEKYSVEELLAMILHYAKTLAEDFAEQSIRDGVITVPVYFNQAERRAMMRVAELAGLRVLQLINDNTAASLHYGVFRRKDFNSTAHNIMFYDQGSASSVATICTYQLVKSKERGFTETNPQLTVRAVGYDRTLGGLAMQLRLQSHLAKLFNEQGKTSQDVFTSPRAMAKLFKEAGRVKKVLSANTETWSQIEGLLDDKDFSAKITRADFEELCADLFPRVAAPIEDALRTSQMTMEEIDQVIIVGGNTRVPRVQEAILNTVNKTALGKSVNADEAAAMGAVYQAAYLSKKYRVKRFIVRDATLYPIQVDFVRRLTPAGADSGSAEGEPASDVKLVSRTLFGLYNPYPQKKVMTFNKHVTDFDFYVNYGDIKHLTTPDDMLIFGSRNISVVSLSGIESALSKHMPPSQAASGAPAEGSPPQTESKGVKAHFRMDDSGILLLDSVESVFEKAPQEEESTLQKIGSTISNLFGGGGGGSSDTPSSPPSQDEGEAGEGGDDSASDTPSSSDSDDTSTTDTPSSSTDTPTGDEEQSGDTQSSGTADSDKDESDTADKAQSEGNNDTTSSSSSDTKSSNATNTTTTSTGPAKPLTIKEPITLTLERRDMPDLDDTTLEESRRKLERLSARDRDKLAREAAKNALESFLFDMRDKLETSESYRSCGSDGEREELEGKLVRASEWLEEDGYEADTEEYKSRLRTLQSETSALRGRVQELERRPEALQALTSMLNYSSTFLAGVRNLTEELQIFTETEMSTLDKLVRETRGWMEEKVVEQGATPLTSPPVITVRDVAERVQALDREVKYMLNKAKTAKPKPTTSTTSTPPPTPSDSDNTTGTDSDTTGTGSDTTGTGSDTTETGGDTTEVDNESTETGSDSTETGSDTTGTGSDSTETDSDSTETDSTETGSRSTETGSESGQAGSDADADVGSSQTPRPEL